MNENSGQTLKGALEAYKQFVAGGESAYAILYTPGKCYLALVNDSGEFEVQDNANRFNVENIFEARIFNPQAELRWLRGYGAVIITDDTFKSDTEFVDPSPQSYLLWGQSTGKFSADRQWTEFGEARVGAFYVPVPNVAAQGYARITAIEYLKRYEDFNIAVVDERLTGIEAV